MNKLNKKIFGKIETLISQDTKIEGTIEASGTLRIDGTVIGGISKASGVIIGATGIIEGNINAQGVSHAGKVIGNINAESSLELMHESVLQGDIRTAQLSIAEGAYFDGSCSMISEKNNEASGFSKETLETTEEPT